MPHRAQLLEKLAAYTPAPGWEADCHASIIHFVEKHATCFNRTHEAGHITGSAWVINPARTKAALVNHPKLNMWLQAGGHSDGNPDTQAVARLEASEEFGVPLDALKPLGDDIFHLDCHLYPARVKNGQLEEMHIHHDIRFIFELDDALPFGQNAGEVITEKKWILLTELLNQATDRDGSIAKMARKSLELFS